MDYSLLRSATRLISPSRRAEERVRANIDSICIGWSRDAHWHAFKTILCRHSHIRDICMLGVYHGRDIAYIAAILQSFGRDFRIVGVDLFEDVPNTDWAEADRGKKWSETWLGPAPDLDAANANLERLGIASHVRLVKANFDDYLARRSELFDFIYIDIAHDYASTIKAIDLSREGLKPNGVLAGDDFSNQGTWGVKRAVEEKCPKFEVFDDWIWCEC